MPRRLHTACPSARPRNGSRSSPPRRSTACPSGSTTRWTTWRCSSRTCRRRASPDLLGLYHGIPLSTARHATTRASLPDHITLYRAPIERAARGERRPAAAHHRAHGGARGRAPLRDQRRAAARDRCLLVRVRRPSRLRRADDAPGAGGGRGCLDAGDVPVGAVIARDGEILAARRQRARAAAGPHRARRGPRAARGGDLLGLVAAGRLHAVRHAGAVRDVRGRDRARAARPGGVRRARSEGGLRGFARQPAAGRAAQPPGRR